MTKIIYGKKSLSENGILFVNESDFKVPPIDNYYAKLSIPVLNQISQTYLGDKKICELFLYRDVPIWWFCYARLTTYFVSTIGFIHNFCQFIEKHNPTEIHIEDNFSKFTLIQEICNSKNIKFSFSTTGYAKFKSFEKVRSLAKKQSIKLVTRKKINSRIDLYKKHQLPDLKNKFLFASYSGYRREIYDPTTQKFKIGEFLMDDIVDLLQISPNSVGIDFFSKIRFNEHILKSRFLTRIIRSLPISPISIGVDFFSNAQSDDHILKARLKDDFDWFPADVLISENSISNHTEFLQNFDHVINSASFLNLFTFQNISFGRYLLPFLKEFLFDCYIPYWLNLLDSLEIHISSNRPKTVFLFFETGPSSLALISVCRKLGIKTIGMQHGIIHDAHVLYMHDDLYSVDNPHGFILPDHLLLFGDITKNYLLNRNYPKNTLISFCNPSFLNIKILKNSYKEILTKYNIPNNKKVVLFALPGLKQYADSKTIPNKKILEKLLDDLTDDFFLIVKPHPADDISFYTQIVDKSTKNNVNIISGNIMELISISDLLISTASTTIIDAMCLNTPVIQVIMPNMDHNRPYNDFDAVLRTSLENLFSSIQKLLLDKNIQEKLELNGKIFVKKYYNIPLENPKSILENVMNLS